MTAAISIPFRERLLQAYFHNDIFHVPDQLFVALTVGVGLINQSGSSLDEPTAGAYARAEITLDSDHWALSGFGEIYNSSDIDWPPPADGEDWGYLGGWALLDAPDGGVTLAVGTIIVPTFYTSDLPFLSMGPGALTIGLID